MEDQQEDIDYLLSDAGDFVETKVALFKLKAIESLVDVSSDLVTGLGLLSILFLFILIFSIGFALVIGDWLGKNFYGFFIIGGLYGIAGLICYARKDRWLQEPFGNLLIRKILK